jgi:AcrR family transcriptional regulator
VTEGSQAQRIARLKRTELLEAAVDELVAHGWRGLQMQAVAKRVGVSRQTVYNTFSGRDGLAAAMIEYLTDSFLDGFDAAFGSGDSPARRWENGVRYLLRRGDNDPALRAMLGLDSGQQFLGLLTSGSAPIVRRARERIPATVLRFQPELSPESLTHVAELLARLTLSEIVQPIAELDAAVLTVSSMVAGFLNVASLDVASSDVASLGVDSLGVDSSDVAGSGGAAGPPGHDLRVAGGVV